MAKLHIDIITPERVVISQEADSVTLPASEGEITVLPEHIPLFTQIHAGVVLIREGKTENTLAIQGGFLEVANDRIKVLTNFAVRDSEVEMAKVEAAKKRAEQIIAEKKSSEDLIMAQAELQRSLLQLKVASRRKSH
jgi:F-type H+-transporting ATPase subunit epsilon